MKKPKKNLLHFENKIIACKHCFSLRIGKKHFWGTLILDYFLNENTFCSDYILTSEMCSTRLHADTHFHFRVISFAHCGEGNNEFWWLKLSKIE